MTNAFPLHNFREDDVTTSQALPRYMYIRLFGIDSTIQDSRVDDLFDLASTKCLDRLNCTNLQIKTDRAAKTSPNENSLVSI